MRSQSGGDRQAIYFGHSGGVTVGQFVAIRVQFAFDDLQPPVAAFGEGVLETLPGGQLADVEIGVLVDRDGTVASRFGRDEVQLSRLNFGEGLLGIARLRVLEIGHDPDLQQMDRVRGGIVHLAVLDARARRDPLHIAAAHDGGVAHRIAVTQRAIHDIGDNLHVPVRMHPEAHLGRDKIFVDDAQGTEMSVRRVIVIGEAEGVVGIEPTVVGVASFLGFAKCDHSFLSRTNKLQSGQIAKDYVAWLVIPFRYAHGMELRHLRYFVIVAEEQNVTRAAARLHVSQPPLSRQIRDLEAELGVELFRRTAKSLALTEAGKIFLIEARAILLRVDEAVETVRTVANHARATLHVGYAPSLTVRLLPKTLMRFERENPGVRVSLHDLSSEECIRQLAAGKIDLALTVRPPASRMRGLVFEKLARYPLCCAVAASHPLADKKAIALRDLKRERFIVYSLEDYPEYYESLRTLFRPVGFEPRIGEEHDGATGLIAAVEAGQGIAIVASSLGCLTGQRLKLLPLHPKVPPFAVGALRPEKGSKLTHAFVAAAKWAVTQT